MPAAGFQPAPRGQKPRGGAWRRPTSPIKWPRSRAGLEPQAATMFRSIGGFLVAALRALMRVFSYLFHGLLTLFLLAISLVALSSGQPLQLEMLPWQGQTLTWWLLSAALAGLLSVILAICRKWRSLFFLWSLAVLAMLAKGFFFSHYYFAGPPEFHRALYLTAGALIAAFGAWFTLRREPLR